MITRTVYEYQTVRVQPHGILTKAQLTALRHYHHTVDDRLYRMVDRGIQFQQYVGVLAVGGLRFEVLPKVGREQEAADLWRERLLDLLDYCGDLPRERTATATGAAQPGDLPLRVYTYYRQQLSTVLQHDLLARRYRSCDVASPALTGRLRLAEQLRRPPPRPDFLVSRSAYSYDTCANAYLQTALRVAINRSGLHPIHHSLRRLLQEFPHVTETARPPMYTKLGRYAPPYRAALRTAQLILAGHQPSTRQGGEQLPTALMFDMNRLWERFVGRLALELFRRVEVQTSRPFWQHAAGTVQLRPDVIVHGRGQQLILDAKWKVPRPGRASGADLRQLYVYAREFGAHRVALVFPGAHARVVGHFTRDAVKGELLYLPLGGPTDQWLADCRQKLVDWCSE